MKYTIHNDILQLMIDSLGGEMMSIKTVDDGCEYLWQGDAAFWSGRAIHLFPICGRLFEGTYTYRGETYQMGAHGFLRGCEMTVLDHQTDQISFGLTDSEETRKQYPFSFELIVTYRLMDHRISVSFEVHNTDQKDLIFTLGGHPGFGLPFEQGLSFEDYTLTFDRPCHPEQIQFSPTCFLTGETPPYSLIDDRTLALRHDLFDHDAIFLQNMSKTVTLASFKSEKKVHLSCQDMKYLGFWHTPKSEAPFVCIEPWLGIPSFDHVVDDLETKKDMIHLPSGDVFRTEYSITIE